VTWFKFEDYGHFVHVHKYAIFKRTGGAKVILDFQNTSVFPKLKLE
jgi:hypothetical protein